MRSFEVGMGVVRVLCEVGGKVGVVGVRGDD